MIAFTIGFICGVLFIPSLPLLRRAFIYVAGEIGRRVFYMGPK